MRRDHIEGDTHTHTHTLPELLGKKQIPVTTSSIKGPQSTVSFKCAHVRDTLGTLFGYFLVAFFFYMSLFW